MNISAGNMKRKLLFTNQMSCKATYAIVEHTYQISKLKLGKSQTLQVQMKFFFIGRLLTWPIYTFTGYFSFNKINLSFIGVSLCVCENAFILLGHFLFFYTPSYIDIVVCLFVYFHHHENVHIVGGLFFFFLWKLKSYVLYTPRLSILLFYRFLIFNIILCCAAINLKLYSRI